MEMTKGERTASRILDAAEAMFAQRGYTAASLRDIAVEANVTQPALYNHFGSKEALYRAVLQRGLGPSLDLLKFLVDQPLSHEALIELPGRALDLLADHQPVAAFLIQAAHSDDDEGGKIASEWLERLLGISRTVNEAASGEIDETDVLLRQIALFHLCCGYFWSAPLIARYTGRNIQDPDMIAAQKRLLASVMGQLFPE